MLYETPYLKPLNVFSPDGYKYAIYGAFVDFQALVGHLWQAADGQHHGGSCRPVVRHDGS